MKKTFFLPIFLLLSLFIFSCNSSDDVPAGNPLEAQTLLNVSYGSNSQQAYDLYLPADRNATDTKVIMLIHGGAWTSGDKNDMNTTVALLQNLHPDYAIVNVNYVLGSADHYAFPNQFLDIQAVIQKITSERNQLQINPEFGIIGTSAGAHIALMYDNVYDQDNQVKFVADIVGPSDFTDPFYDENFDIPLIVQVLVDPDAYPAGTDYLEELSPVFHVNSTSSPVCMFYGNEDPLVTESNGISLKAKLDQFGVENTLRIYDGGHGDNWNNEDFNEMMGIIGDYIEEYL